MCEGIFSLLKYLDYGIMWVILAILILLNTTSGLGLDGAGKIDVFDKIGPLRTLYPYFSSKL